MISLTQNEVSPAPHRHLLKVVPHAANASVTAERVAGVSQGWDRVKEGEMAANVDPLSAFGLRGKHLTVREKAVIVRVYRWVDERKNRKGWPRAGRVRDIVGEIVGVSDKTVANAWNEWEESGTLLPSAHEEGENGEIRPSPTRRHCGHRRRGESDRHSRHCDGRAGGQDRHDGQARRPQVHGANGSAATSSSTRLPTTRSCNRLSRCGAR
jgi:hypothetical protein